MFSRALHGRAMAADSPSNRDALRPLLRKIRQADDETALDILARQHQGQREREREARAACSRRRRGKPPRALTAGLAAVNTLRLAAAPARGVALRDLDTACVEILSDWWWHAEDSNFPAAAPVP